MKKRTNDVLLQYFEQTLSDELTLQALLQAAADAFAGLLDADAVYFFTKKGTWLPPADPAGDTSPPEPDGGQKRPGRTKKARKGSWAAAPPQPEMMKKIKTCMAKRAGRSVCVCEKDAAGMAWWLFWLKTGQQVCGAAVCTASASPDGETLSVTHRLARCIAPRFAALAKEPRRPGLQGQLSVSLADDTAALLSHEFKSPLTVALSSLQLLRRKLEIEAETVPEDTKTYLDYTELNLYKALRIAINLIEAQYDRPGGGMVSPEYVDLIDLAKKLSGLVADMQLYAEIVGVRLAFENCAAAACGNRVGEACGIVCDAFHLERILLNLVSNALKHAPKNSTVRILLEENGPWLLIHVEDAGSGIPEEARGRLFEKFWRGPNERTGTGLGLYLSQRFAEGMGGMLRAENRPQGGACFTLCVPLSPPVTVDSGRRIDPGDMLLRIEFSELPSQKCI